MATPTYQIELKITSSNEDTPALTQKGNANFVEIQNFLNDLRDSILVLENSNTNGGVTTQEDIENAINAYRQVKTIDGTNHVSLGVQTYNSGTDDEYTVTYAINADGFHTYTVSSSVSLDNRIVQVKVNGEVEYPHITTIAGNVILAFGEKIPSGEVHTIIIL